MTQTPRRGIRPVTNRPRRPPQAPIGLSPAQPSLSGVPEDGPSFTGKPLLLPLKLVIEDVELQRRSRRSNPRPAHSSAAPTRAVRRLTRESSAAFAPRGSSVCGSCSAAQNQGQGKD